MGFDFNNPVYRQTQLDGYVLDSYDFVNEETEEYITVQDHYNANTLNPIMHSYCIGVNFDNDNVIEYQQKRFGTILQNCLGLHSEFIELVINSLIDQLCTLGIIHNNKDYKDF